MQPCRLPLRPDRLAAPASKPATVPPPPVIWGQRPGSSPLDGSIQRQARAAAGLNAPPPAVRWPATGVAKIVAPQLVSRPQPAPVLQCASSFSSDRVHLVKKKGKPDSVPLTRLSLGAKGFMEQQITLRREGLFKTQVIEIMGRHFVMDKGPDIGIRPADVRRDLDAPAGSIPMSRRGTPRKYSAIAPEMDEIVARFSQESSLTKQQIRQRVGRDIDRITRDHTPKGMLPYTAEEIDTLTEVGAILRLDKARVPQATGYIRRTIVEGAYSFDQLLAEGQYVGAAHRGVEALRRQAVDGGEVSEGSDIEEESRRPRDRASRSSSSSSSPRASRPRLRSPALSSASPRSPSPPPSRWVLPIPPDLRSSSSSSSSSSPPPLWSPRFGSPRYSLSLLPALLPIPPSLRLEPASSAPPSLWLQPPPAPEPPRAPSAGLSPWSILPMPPELRWSISSTHEP
jgi:hypothetical protein